MAGGDSSLAELHARIARLEAERDLFEHAANERLEVLCRADAELKRSLAAENALRADCERTKAELAEARRILKNVAMAELRATRELLELKNEGLLHSIVRRIRRLTNPL